MQKKICFAALALPALLLAGCADSPLEALLPAENTATVETAATPQPQTLNVYATQALLPAVQNYASSQQVTLQVTEDPAAADLVLLDHKPDGFVEGVDVMSDTLLAAAAARAGITESTDALPLGRSLYGYWANGTLLNSLLGDGGVTALQNASWDEWSDFVETLQAWLEEPGAAVAGGEAGGPLRVAARAARPRAPCPSPPIPSGEVSSFFFPASPPGLFPTVVPGPQKITIK